MAVMEECLHEIRQWMIRDRLLINDDKTEFALIGTNAQLRKVSISTLRIGREFKKLRRQLQGKRLIKTELCVKLSLLRLSHVDHVVQNRRSALSLACHEWFSCKGKEGKIHCCELPLSSKPQI